MEDLAAGFCRGAKERPGLRYPEELRQLAVEYARQAREQGHSRQRIAARLGLSEWSLVRWLRRCAEAGDSRRLRVHEVKVTEPAPSQPVLVMPSGARVEGLSLRELVEILGALG
jgi:transposase-like protein